MLLPLLTAFEHSQFGTIMTGTSVMQKLSTYLKMSRLSKIAWLSFALAAVMILTDITSRTFLGLAFLMFVRCNMRKEEVRTWNFSARSHLPS
jgi:hypothetical protein